jgi:hypothetical protein
VNRRANAILALRRAEACDQRAEKERELARRARATAELAEDPGRRGELDKLAVVHDHAVVLQTQAANYYRGLADRIEFGLLA